MVTVNRDECVLNGKKFEKIEVLDHSEKGKDEKHLGIGKVLEEEFEVQDSQASKMVKFRTGWKERKGKFRIDWIENNVKSRGVRR